MCILLVGHVYYFWLSVYNIVGWSCALLLVDFVYCCWLGVCFCRFAVCIVVRWICVLLFVGLFIVVGWPCVLMFVGLCIIFACLCIDVG